jgi:precorrin-8X/cobalt-precorrin-8 methylmutase
MMFDTVVMVDWSAANVARQGRDSIWLCRRDVDGETLVNPPTRHQARTLLADWLATAQRRGHRTLLGFDFPFGYPAGFASRLGLAGAPWRAVWGEIAGLLEDGPNNRNNRFDVAAGFNRRVSNGPFPFWGCPAGRAGPFLAPTFHRGHDGATLAERRLIDRPQYMPGAQPCWKLCYTGSVGSQALTGIPVVRALRGDSRWRDVARIWPFETGLRPPPPDVQLIFAEVYPSLWREPIRAAHKAHPAEPLDKIQVSQVAALLAERDRSATLSALFYGDPALTRDERRQVEDEEAWTLGVTAPRGRPPSAPIAGVAGARSGPRPTPPPRAGEGSGEPSPRKYDYLRDPQAIARRSAALVRAEADLARFPRSLRPVALRIAQATGDPAVIDDLAWSAKAVTAGRSALAAGRPVIVDAGMVAAGIRRDRLPAGNDVRCFLRDPAVAALAGERGTTRSAAAVELWRPDLEGAVVAIGNAPTALFRLLEILAEGVGSPALILGFPVGLVGAAEAKAALAAFGGGIEFITLHGRRGGSAVAAAAVNALSEPR